MFLEVVELNKYLNQRIKIHMSKESLTLELEKSNIKKSTCQKSLLSIPQIAKITHKLEKMINF
jgi:hypothetical protein